MWHISPTKGANHFRDATYITTSRCQPFWKHPHLMFPLRLGSCISDPVNPINTPPERFENGARNSWRTPFCCIPIPCTSRCCSTGSVRRVRQLLDGPLFAWAWRHDCSRRSVWTSWVPSDAERKLRGKEPSNCQPHFGIERNDRTQLQSFLADFHTFANALPGPGCTKARQLCNTRALRPESSRQTMPQTLR
jgi:hypothetical protein